MKEIGGDYTMPVPIQDLYNILNMYNDMELQIIVDPSKVVIFKNGPFKFTYHYLDNEVYMDLMGDSGLPFEGKWSVIADELSKIWSLINTKEFIDGYIDIIFMDEGLKLQITPDPDIFSYYELMVLADATYEYLEDEDVN